MDAKNWYIFFKQLKDLCLVPMVHPNHGRKLNSFFAFLGIEKDPILFMADREERFNKIRTRSTPNSTAHKHERCFQLKPHSYHPVLVCTFSQSWKTIRTKNCSNVFVRDLEQNFNIIIFKYISLITEHPTSIFEFRPPPSAQWFGLPYRSSSSTLAPKSISSKNKL